MKAISTTTLALLFTLGHFNTALAHGPSLPADPFNETDWFVFPGVTLGGTSSLGHDTGFHAGGELSFGRTIEHLYIGAVADVIYDHSRGGVRGGFGPELGLGPVGVDGGLLLEDAGGPLRKGAFGRLFISLGVVFAYVRYGGLWDAPDFIEYGVGFKLPLHRKVSRYDDGRVVQWHLWPVL